MKIPRLAMTCAAGLLPLFLAPFAVAASTPLEPPVWEPQGPVVWEQDCEELRAHGAAPVPGYLVSRASYGPLRLRLTFWIAPETNSGVFIGCAPGAAISPTACIEINLWDRHPNPDWRSGALVGIAPSLAHVETLAAGTR